MFAARVRAAFLAAAERPAAPLVAAALRAAAERSAAVRLLTVLVALRDSADFDAGLVLSFFRALVAALERVLDLAWPSWAARVSCSALRLV